MKKFLLIAAGLILVVFVVLDLIGPDPIYGSKFEAQVPNVEAGVSNAGIKTLKLFVDFSGSMKGFLDFAQLEGGQDAKSTLRSTISTFTDKVEAIYRAKTVVSCGAKSFNKDQFREAMQDKTIFNQGTTLLHDMIAKSCSQVNDSTVVAVVSDCVLSWGKAKLLREKDPYYNKNKQDDLKAAIHSTLLNAKTQGYDLILLQYYSDFNGKYYYNYTENIESGDAYKNKLMKNRPFYVLLVGKKSALKSILDNNCIYQAENIYSSFRNDVIDMKSTRYDIKEIDDSMWNMGEDSDVEGAFWTEISNGDAEGVESRFAIECSDFKIPSYLVKGNLVGAQDNVGSVSEIKYDPANQKIKFVYETVPFKQLNKKTNINIVIESVNQWDTNSINLDDDVAKELADLEKKTWGIGAIIEAIDEAYDLKASDANVTVGQFSFNLYKR